MKFFFLAGVCLLSLALPAAADDAPTWLGFPAKGDATLVEKDGVLTARVPVTAVPNGPDPARVTLQVAGVVPDHHPEEPASGFEARMEASGADHPASLLISTTGLPPPPGSYQLILNVRWPGAPDQKGDLVQTVTVGLQCPAPQFDAAPTVVVGHIEGLFGSVDQPGILRIQELSGRASLRDLHFAVVPDVTAPLPADRPSLEVLGIPPVIAAGTTVEATVRPTGTFALGKSTGKLEILSRQLASPLLVAYEVHTRLPLYWIGVVAALGALLGWLVRVYLQDLQARTKALATASESLQSLKEAARKVKDPHYTKAIADEIATLEKATRSNAAAAAILSAAADASKHLADLLAKLEADRTNLVGPLKTAHDALSLSWTLPTELHPFLLQAQGSVDAVAREAADQHFHEALAALQADLTDGPCALLVNQLEAWGDQVSAYWDNLKLYCPPLPDGGFAQVTGAMASWKQTYGAAAPPTSATDPAKLAAALYAIQRAFKAAQDIAAYVSASSQEFVQTMNDSFSADEDGSGDEIQHLGRLTQQAADQISDDLNASPPALKVLSERLQHLKDSWRATLSPRLSTETDREQFQALLTANKWPDALKLAAAAHKKTALDAKLKIASEGTGLGLTEDFSEAVAAIAQPFGFGAPPALERSGGALDVPDLPPLQGTPAERAGLQERTRRALFLQTAIVSILFILTTYALFADHWTGTFGEFMAVFFAAYAFDFSSDALVGVAKKLVTAI